MPLIYEIHALQTNLTGIVIESALIRTGRVAGIVVVSDVLRTDLLARYRHLDPKRVVVAHDAAWPVTNHPDPLWRRPRDTLQVGYVGSFFPGKGAHFTVQLARACPEFDFHIVGGSTREQVALRCANPPDNVTIHGHITHSDLSRVYAALDVGLVPNAAHVLDHGGQDIGRWTSPLKLFEYMSHGLTVVASDLPTIREVVTHAEHAMLAPPGQVAVWAELLRRCATDQNSSRRIAERGRQLVRSRHSWTRRASDVLAAFPAERPLRRPEHDH